jgi:hypothetical protein
MYMAQATVKICAEPGCFTRTRERYCEAHAKDNASTRARRARDKDRKGDNVWKLYNCQAWERFKQSFAGAGNVVCQRIVNGERCRYPTEIHHHLISPRVRPSLMYSYSNCVGVCRQHHPVTEGEPAENLAKLAEIYIPTIAPVFKF